MGGYGRMPQRDWRTETVIATGFILIALFVLWLVLGVK